MAQKKLQLNIYNDQKNDTAINILLCVIIAFLLALICFFRFYSLCGISGPSMLNTLHDKQNVLLKKGNSLNHGDLVVFEHGNKNLIKRVIAMQNDKIAFVYDNEENVGLYFFKNGQFCLVNEDYIFSSPMQKDWFDHFDNFKGGEDSLYKLMPTNELSDTLDIPDEYVITVASDHVFVMGDNRMVSSDSRSIGTVDKAKVFGKVALKLKKDSFLERLLLILYGADFSTDQRINPLVPKYLY